MAKINKTLPAKNNTFNEFVLYTTPNGQVKVEIFLRNDTMVSSILEHTTPHGAIEEKNKKSINNNP